MPAGRWARRFKPIVLADGRTIASLAEARDFLGSLPLPRQQDRQWKYAGELLLVAVDRNEKYSTMDARAQISRALKTEGLL
jgi:hypothetical protein